MENVEQIHEKYHDLKHMLCLLSSGQVKTDDPWTEELKEELQNWEARADTGNQILDTILTEKHHLCIRNHIQLTCGIDGACLKEMPDSDICIIFGNLLDNAIRSVSALPDEDGRLIHILVFERQGFLNISFDNTCSKNVVFENGFPVSDKGDPVYHGFGLKSVCHIVNKYGGVLEFQQEKPWFQVRILLPLPLTRGSENIG
jgi:sensor histidine kinase regulating citrate/malate metabolism